MNRAAHALFVLRTHERLAHVGTPSDGPAARRRRRITARYLQRAGAGAGAGSLRAPLPATAHYRLRRETRRGPASAGPLGTTDRLGGG